MTDRKATIEKIERIRPHSNADTLEFADVLGYQCIVRKGQFREGDLVVYIPEQAIVPEYILKEMNLWDFEKGIGKLAGSKGNRVKAIKLRGETSVGLLYPIVDGILCNEYGIEEAMSVGKENIGEDVSKFLYIVKWEPEIPVQMSGEVCNLAGKTLKYDIENVKNHPDIFDALIKLCIPCSITEKLHGTWTAFGCFPDTHISEEIPHTNCIVTSKGLSAKGLAFKDNEANKNNIYLKMFHKFDERHDFRKLIRDIIFNYSPKFNFKYYLGDPIYFLGEIYGKGVQDLTYGLNDIDFRVFDIYIGFPGRGQYLPFTFVKEITDTYGISMVPELYHDILDNEIVKNLTNGKSSIGNNIREGIVIRPLNEELTNPTIGRIILKSISDDYLNRKNATEYN